MVVVLVALAAVAGCGSSGDPSPAGTSTIGAPPSATEAATTEPEPTEAPTGPASYEIGTPATIDGLQITVLEASYWRGSEAQEPHSGHVFVAYRVEVKGLDGDTFVGNFDFTVANDDGKQGQPTFLRRDEWMPWLMLYEVKEGESQTGWMTFEVPEPARSVVLSYTPMSWVSDEVAATWSTACCGE